MLKITLKAARVNAGLTQKEVANEIGVSNKTLCGWENGRVIPRVCYIDILCSLYGVSYDNISFYPDVRLKRSI